MDSFYDSLKMHGAKLIFSYNLHKDDIPLLRMSNPFLCEVLSTWAKLNFSASVIAISKISHLVDEGGNLLGYDVMKLEIWGLVSAAKSFISELQNEPKHVMK